MVLPISGAATFLHTGCSEDHVVIPSEVEGARPCDTVGMRFP